MSDLFFYGTLRHRPLLQRVLGRALDGVDLIPARLPGHRCAWALDQSGRVQSFPVVEPDRAAAAPGLLARGLGAEDIARLDFYEGGFGYDLLKCPVEPETGAATRARVYIPRPGVWGAGADWSLADWQARWGALALRAAQEVMAYYGRYDAAEVARRFGSIQLRAAAWLPPSPSACPALQ